mgnify:CR=1 FL=1
MREYFIVRVIRVIGPLTIGKYKLTPKISYDLICVPVSGRLAIAKASIGHLPLWGGTKKLAVNAIYKIVSREKEWAIFKYLTEIKAEQGKVSIVIKK